MTRGRRGRGDPTPSTRTPASTRSFDVAKATHALVPRTLRHRALALDCSTDGTRYAVDEPVCLRVTVRNRLPVPVRLRTIAPVPWTWSVDGVDRASTVETLPDETDVVRFGRRECKTFRATWFQRIRVATDEWIAADAGEHTLAARLLVPGAGDRLAATTTVRIE